MNTEIIGIITVFLLAIVLALPVGRYIAKVFHGEKTLLDPIFNPIEKNITYNGFLIEILLFITNR